MDILPALLGHIAWALLLKAFMNSCLGLVWVVRTELQVIVLLPLMARQPTLDPSDSVTAFCDIDCCPSLPPALLMSYEVWWIRPPLGAPRPDMLPLSTLELK